MGAVPPRQASPREQPHCHPEQRRWGQQAASSWEPPLQEQHHGEQSLHHCGCRPRPHCLFVIRSSLLWRVASTRELPRRRAASSRAASSTTASSRVASYRVASSMERLCPGSGLVHSGVVQSGLVQSSLSGERPRPGSSLVWGEASSGEWPHQGCRHRLFIREGPYWSVWFLMLGVK